jgi:hypothetical protein
MNAPTPVSNEARRGSIACVGMGITLGSHLTPLARNHIETADVVFAALSDHVVQLWLERLNPEVREGPHIQRMALRDFAAAEFTGQETLVLPPAHALKPNATMRAGLDALDAVYGTGVEGAVPA